MTPIWMRHMGHETLTAAAVFITLMLLQGLNGWESSMLVGHVERIRISNAGSDNSAGAGITPLPHGHRGWDISDTWASPDNYSISDVSTGDINRDGYMDIVACGGNITRIYLNMKNGTYKEVYNYTYTGHQILSVRIADMNNDGKSDVLMLCSPEEPSSKDVLEIRVLGQRNNLTDFVVSTLEEIEDVYGTGTPSWALGDIDKKNGLDIAIAYTTSSDDATLPHPSVVKLSVLYNTGMFGAFVKDEVASYEGDPNLGSLWGNVALGDVDNDGNMDAVLTVDGYIKYYYNSYNNEYYNTSVYVFPTQNGYLLHQSEWNTTIPNNQFVYGLTVGDFNNDGKNDIAVSTDRKYVSGGWTVEYNDGYIYVMLGNGNGTFSTPHQSYSRTGYGPIYSIVGGSLDENPGMDLAFFQVYSTSDTTYQCRIEIVGNYNPATSQFSEVWHGESVAFEKTRAVASLDRVFSITVANLDNSGLSDIAYGGWNVHVLTIHVDFSDVIPPQVPWMWAYDTPNDNGGSITVEWQEPNDPSVSAYKIYVSMGFLTNVQGLQFETQVNKGTKKAVITTHDGKQALENNVEYFVAVSTVNAGGVENYVVAPYGPVIPTDNQPPGNPTQITATDNPDDNGGAIKLTWTKVTASDFEAYNIYIEEMGYDSCNGLNPKLQIRDMSTTTTVIDNIRGVPIEDEKYYFITVTAMDRSGNEDRHNVVVKSVMSHDNLPPDPISFVEARDVENDNGGAITITWAQSTDPHFDHYNIYISKAKFNNVGTMAPSYTIDDRTKTSMTITGFNGEALENNIPYYVAVTAVDHSGNEVKTVTPVSVTPLDNIPPSLIYSITVTDVPGDNGEALRVSWSGVNDPDFQRYEVYMSNRTFDRINESGVEKIASIDMINQTSITVDKYKGKGLVVGEDYYFTVVAVDVNGNYGLYDESGNYIISVSYGHTVDNIIPAPVKGVKLIDKPNDTGGTLVLSWTEATDEDFHHYAIYIDIKPILTVANMVPDIIINDRKTTSIEISEKGEHPLYIKEEYYAAVTVVDKNGNEDKNTSQSYSGPATPANNIPPVIEVELASNTTVTTSGIAEFEISVKYSGPHELVYTWLVDGVKQIPESNTRFVYKPKASEANNTVTIKVVVAENIDNGLYDSKEWQVTVKPIEHQGGGGGEGERSQGGILGGEQGVYILALIALIVLLILFLFIYRYKKKREAEKAAEEIERNLIQAEEESEAELKAKLKAEKKKAKMEKAKLPKPKETASLPTPRRTPKLSPPGKEKPTLKVKRALPPPTSVGAGGDEGIKAKGPLPPGRDTTTDLDTTGEGDALVEGDYMDILGAMESKEELVPEPKGDGGELEGAEGPRTGPLKEGEEIKRDDDGWIVECIMKNSLPSKYMCPEEQKSTCKLPCIQKMKK